MPTTAQPAAGTALSTDWTTGLLFARNEAETTATTLAAGSGWTRSVVSSGVAWASDSDGRYKQSAGGLEAWKGNSIGPEYTLFAMVKYSSSGGNQTILNCDANPPRHFIFRITSSGTVLLILFDSGGSIIANVTTTATVSTTAPTPVIARVRNVSGTYKVRIWVGSTATAETDCTGTPFTIPGTQDFAIGDSLGGGATLTPAKSYFSAIWNNGQTDTDLTTLGANGWAIYDAKLAAPASVLSSPAGTATGNGTASGTVTTTGTDGTLYAVRSAAQPSNSQIVAGQDSTGAATAKGSLSITSAGAKTVALGTTAVPVGSQTVWFLHRPAAGAGSDSNVVSAAWTQPATLAWSGTYPNQSCVAGAAFVHSGSIPTPTGGVGSKTYSATGLGASGLTMNSSTGQLQGTGGTAGTYTITPTVTDSSTAGSPAPQTATLAAFTLTISAAGSAPTVSANPSNLTVASGSSATFSGGFNGSPTLSLQWQEFIGGVWTAMSGQTGVNLSLGTVTLVDSGRSFRLGCTNPYGGPIYTSSATLTVTAAAVGTITSDVLADWGDATPLASLTIPFVTIEKVSDASIVLQLTNQITGTNGKLVITDAAIVTGTDYMLALRNAAGTIRGYKKYTAT